MTNAMRLVGLRHMAREAYVSEHDALSPDKRFVLCSFAAFVMYACDELQLNITQQNMLRLLLKKLSRP